MNCKFQLRNLTGKILSHYLVSQKAELDISGSGGARKHHIIVVDRSGSMYYDMGSLKESLRKVLTLHEFHDDTMLVSLISYSSKGDVTLHFSGIPICDVPINEIDRLRATSLTCISQALEEAEKVIDDDHVTGITLHSDGFANDPSSFAEKRKIMEACQTIAGHNVFVNTVAHSDYSDFQLLSTISNAVSGKCVKARGIKELYKSISNTFDALKNNSTSTVTVPIGDSTYMVFVDREQKRIIGTEGDLNICGVNPNGDMIVYAFKPVSESEFNACTSPECTASEAIYAFARANLAQGRINMAKYILASTRDTELFNGNWRAATAPQLAHLAISLEDRTFDGPGSDISSSPIIIDDSITALDVLRTIEAHKADVMLDLNRLEDLYQRRGVKKIVGTREKDGTVVEPWVDTELLDKSGLATITSLDISTSAANVALKVTRKCRLTERKTGEPITNVAGIKMDSLDSFNNYTVIGDGELNMPNIPIKISKKSAFEALVKLGVLYRDSTPAVTYDFNADYMLKIDKLPVTRFSVDTGDLKTVFQKMAVAKILSSIAEASSPAETSDLTTEQVEALKAHHLSKNLYLNLPVTNEYADLQEAIGSGSIDVQTSFKIKFGADGILGLSSFRSAKDFLDRMYVPEFSDGRELGKKEKATWNMFFDEQTQGWAPKTLSARSKVTAADGVQKQIFDFMLGVSQVDTQGVVPLLREAGVDTLADVLSNPPASRSEHIGQIKKGLVEVGQKLNRYSHKLYSEKLFPLTMFVGATGMIPDDWDAVPKTAEELKQSWPEAKIGKAEADGIFYQDDETVLGVYTEKRYVSVTR